MRKASLVIVNYFGDEDTLSFIESIKKTDYPNYDVIVVDNGSKDLSKRLPEHVKYIKNPKNVGHAAAMNVGILASTGEYIVVLNNDMLVHEPCWLKELVAVAESDRRIGIVRILGMRFNEPDVIDSMVHGMKNTSGERHVGQFPRVMEQDYAGIALLKRDMVARIGLYGPFFLWHAELDYARRARRGGWRIVLATRAKLLHKHGASVKKLHPLLNGYYYYTDKLRCVWRGMIDAK